MNQKIQILEGGIAEDKRGSVSFVNAFTFKNVKRFYRIQNSLENPIRAFHGHMKEAKYFYVASGSIILCAVPLDNPNKPSKETKVQKYVLSAKKPTVLYIPPGYANGFKSLEPQTIVIVFSTASLQESLDDDFRYPANYWGEKLWERK